jgi:hypothetical protein
MNEKELHETFMLDLDYRIAEARKNSSMHNATAATLESLKDLFARRIEEHKRRTPTSEGK